jgi:hypothetical protein
MVPPRAIFPFTHPVHIRLPLAPVDSSPLKPPAYRLAELELLMDISIEVEGVGPRAVVLKRCSNDLDRCHVLSENAELEGCCRKTTL